MKKILSITIAAALLSVFQSSAQIDRTKVPEAGPAPVVEFGDFEKFTLDNGLRVILVEDHDRPLVSVGINFIIDPFVEGDKAGESQFFGEVWSKGTSNRTAEQINNEVDFLGASFRTGSSSIGFTTLTKYTDRMMDILTDVLYNPTFPQEEIDKMRDQYLGALQLSSSQPSSIITNIQAATVYPEGHPYRDIMTEATVNNITADDCREYYDKYIIPNSAIMIIVGDMKLKEAKALCSKYLASWEAGEVIAFEDPGVNRPEGIEVVFSPKDGAVQSTIRMMAPISLTQDSEDLMALQIANGIYGGGGFDAKLFRNLRETHGWTYGAYSSIRPDEVSGTFYALGDVNSNATDSSFVQMRYELQNMTDGVYTEDDLKKFKTMFAGDFSRSLESSDQIAQFAYNIERYGLPADYYATYLQKLDALTMDDIRRVVAKYFDPDNMYWFCVGDPSVIPALAAYDSDGVVVELDFEGKPIERKEVSADVTVESVLENYLNAIGGRTLVEGIDDMTETVEMDVMGMAMATTTKRIISRKCFSVVQTMGGNQASSIVLRDGKINVSAGAMEQEITDPEQVEAMSDIYPFPEILGPEQGYVFTLEGIESVEGSDAYKVRQEKRGAVVYNFYDVATGLKVKSIVSSQGQTQEVFYGDYQKTAYGILYPMSQTMPLPQWDTVKANVTDVKFNTGLTPDQL